MNNFCTYCGKRLKKGCIQCNSCKTSVVDLSKVSQTDYLDEKEVNKEYYENKNKQVRFILYGFIGVIVGFILFRIGFNIYEKNRILKIVPKYVNDDIVELKYIKKSNCKKCVSSCDGSCMDYDNVEGCYIHKIEVIYSNGSETIEFRDDDGEYSIDGKSYYEEDVNDDESGYEY